MIKTATTLSVADQMTRLSHILYADLPGNYGHTSIDSSTPGVITIAGMFAGNVSPLAHEAELASAWNRVRAVDGGGCCPNGANPSV